MPTLTVVTSESETLHTVGESERNDTGRRPAASVEADRVTGWPRKTSFGWSKVIVCGLVPACAWNELRTGRAAA